MINEDYCSYEVAKLLKEKGFDEPCTARYGTDKRFIRSLSHFKNSEINKDAVNVPTHQMAMKWLREEKRTSVIIEFDLTNRGYCPYVHQLDYDMDWVVKWRVNTPMKYEQAVEAALRYCLENLI